MISPLAYIHPDAKIGNNVRVDPFAVIEANTTIGDNTHVMTHATILEHTHIGRGCTIFPSAVVGAVPQDLKYAGEKAIVEIGDNNVIRECVTIHRGTTDRMKTSVGNNCLLMAYTHLAHDCMVGNNVILANCVQLAGHVTVGDYAIIGGMSAANQFSTIGMHAYIAGGSEIRKDVPPYIRAARQPLSYVGVNSVGLERRGFSQQTINEIHEIYRLLYVSGMNTSHALESIEKDIPSSTEKNTILNFIKDSTRGIIKGLGKGSADED